MSETVLSSSARVSREDLRTLLLRRDADGLAHIAVQAALFALLAVATVTAAAAGSDARFPLVFLCGLALTTFFPALHEAGHGTAFATPWINRAVTAVSAALMLQAPTFFREFHWEHHRRTQDPTFDPEISSAPSLLGPWPGNPMVYLGLASGQGLMVGKAAWTLACAVLPASAQGRLFPFVRPSERDRVARESRIVVAALGAALLLGLRFVPGFATLLLAWPVAHLALGFYLMAEHTGLPSGGSQFHRTRTVISNRALRWAMWNMPYHAEHHAYPGVPFHAAPRLHRLVRGDLENVASGYLAFHAEAIARAFRSR